ncbi:MAG TPA: hypothetical protein VKT82_19305 [Ktedonobacterales bacterium]|nr:hypothetical protein [Ktedonobacterales bacterium]
MDPLFWILAGVVVGCVVGIVIILRLEMQAERRAADTKRVEAEVSARLKIFDPRAAVEELDTRPIPAASHPDVQGAPRPKTPVASPSSSLADKILPPPIQPSSPVAHPVQAAAPELPDMQLQPLSADGMQIRQPSPLSEHDTESMQPPLLPAFDAEPSQPSPLPTAGVGTQWAASVNGKADPTTSAEALPATPEAARLRAAELGRERRYLEQSLEEQQARLEQLLHQHTPDNTQELAAIHQLQSELAEQRHHLHEIIVLEERCRQLAVPSLEQLAREYKNTASPHTPRAFGVRRHKLAPIDPPGKNPPGPPAQAKTDTSS